MSTSGAVDVDGAAFLSALFLVEVSMSPAIRLHAVYSHAAVAVATFLVDDVAVSVSLNLDEAALRKLLAPHVVVVDDGVDVDTDRLAELRRRWEDSKTRSYDDPSGRARDQLTIQREREPLEIALQNRAAVAAIVAEGVVDVVADTTPTTEVVQ